MNTKFLTLLRNSIEPERQEMWRNSSKGTKLAAPNISRSLTCLCSESLRTGHPISIVWKIARPADTAVRMRKVLARPWVGVCVFLVLSLHYFQCNRIKFNLFLSITVFHDIFKQIQQRLRIGKIFARWHLAIAITSINGKFDFWTKSWKNANFSSMLKCHFNALKSLLLKQEHHQLWDVYTGTPRLIVVIIYLN